jgi:hypothetical protein
VRGVTPVSKAKYGDACKISRQAVYKAVERGDVVERPDGKIDLDNSTNKVFQKHCLDRHAEEEAKKGPAPAKKKQTKKSIKASGSGKGKKKAGANGKGKSASETKEGANNSAAEIGTPEGGDQVHMDYDLELSLDSVAPELQDLLTGGIGDMKKVNVDSVKSLEDIKSKLLDRLIKRNKFVDRALIREVFGKLYSIDNTELKTFGMRFAPDVAALLQNQIEVIRTEEPDYKDSPILVRLNEFVNSTDFMRTLNNLASEEMMKTLAHIKRIMDEFLLDKGAEPLEDNEPEEAEPELAEVEG